MENQKNSLQDKAKIVSFINMKGGVGKTTLCIELGKKISSELSGKDNQRILFIDIDPQSNLTQAMMEHYYPENEDETDVSIQNLFVKHPTGADKSSIIFKINDKIDLIPGELETVFLERSSGSSTANELLNFINDFKIKRDYKYIFIDCPPTYSIYTEMAFYVSDYYLVPVIPDKYATVGVDLLERVVADIIRLNRNTVFQNKEYPKNLGIIFTRVDDKNKKKQAKFQNAMRKSNIVKEDELYVFKNVFRESNKLSTFPLGKFISDTKDTRLLKEIDKICSEFEDRINILETDKTDN